MRAVVFAYANMGLAGLAALERNGFDIRAIFSHEDDPGENCWFGSVKAWGDARGIPVFCPETVNTPDWAEEIERHAPQVLFSFYYRNMIADTILALAPAGAFNLHGSLLPAYRGRAPINWVIVNGETETGVTLHAMVRRADAGDIVGQERVAIDPLDTAFSLYAKLCEAAAVLLDRVLPLIREGRTPRTPQDESRASVYRGRRPEDGKIDWTWDAARVYNLIRAVTEPYPGAFTRLPDGEKMMIWWAFPVTDLADAPAPGQVTVEHGGVMVGTGNGALILKDAAIGTQRMKNGELTAYFARKEGIVLT